MPTKSAISFGLVHIPISLHTATADIDIRFNQLHKDTKERIRYKKTCANCGEEEIKELPKSYAKQSINEAELSMAKTLEK